MQSITLESAKEGIVGLNSNGTKGTVAGRKGECATLTRAVCVLRGWDLIPWRSEAATSDFLLKEHQHRQREGTTPQLASSEREELKI